MRWYDDLTGPALLDLELELSGLRGVEMARVRRYSAIVRYAEHVTHAKAVEAEIICTLRSIWTAAEIHGLQCTV